MESLEETMKKNAEKKKREKEERLKEAQKLADRTKRTNVYKPKR